MAGVTIRVELDDREVRRALDRLAKAGADLTPAMREIGETLLNSARKPRNKGKVLTLDGSLRGTLAARAGADSVEVGSPLIYAGTHQFGAPAGSFAPGIPWGDIPARPFLVDADGRLAPADEDAIREIVLDHLARAVGGLRD